MKSQNTTHLRRVLGGPTALLVGMGVAIGSGVFRTPGDVAGQLGTPSLIILAWVIGGIFVTCSGMVTAELATRFPRAGGEYVYLREAYGEFVAFFFGWAYTFFIVGGGAAAIAAAFGDFSCAFFQADASQSRWFAAGAIVVVTLVNAAGLRVGAGAQNCLTVAKIAALLGVVVVAWTRGDVPIDWTLSAVDSTDNRSMLVRLTAGVVPVLWAYLGTTDAGKLAEEIKDVRRALPRALLGSAAALTALYVLVNVALMRLIPVSEMVGLESVHGEAMARVFGPAGRSAMLIVAMLVCLSSLSATVLATVRVTFALARDGLAFGVLARMSNKQAPIPALTMVGAFAIVLVLSRRFGQVLEIYTLAAAILFGLSYASLIVFRLREKSFPSNVFRCPLGYVLAGGLVLFELVMAYGVAVGDPIQAVYTLALLAGFAATYFIWKRWA
jgi:basic amino acid/polyamine antiporter, APA family